MPPSAPPLWETFSLSRPSLEKSLSFVTRTWLFVFHTRPPSALAAGGGSFFACASRGERREYLENDTIAISSSGEQASCLYPVWDIGRTLLLSGWKMCTVLRKGGKNRRLFLIRRRCQWHTAPTEPTGETARGASPPLGGLLEGRSPSMWPPLKTEGSFYSFVHTKSISCPHPSGDYILQISYGHETQQSINNIPIPKKHLFKCCCPSRYPPLYEAAPKLLFPFKGK
jgi:hypothetical protein